jgi:hypothetical protein
MIFQNFSAENSIFSQHFWGKIFRGKFRGIFPGINVQKIAQNTPTGFFNSSRRVGANFYVGDN